LGDKKKKTKFLFLSLLETKRERLFCLSVWTWRQS